MMPSMLNAPEPACLVIAMLEAEMARRAEDAAASPEPDLPTSAGRFLAPAVDPAPARSS